MKCPLKKRWERRKEARPQELLAAALELFAERGYAMTRLDDVASHAGVSKGTLYLYFTNKEELFKAVIRENMVPVLGEAESIINAYEGDTASLLREIVQGWWERISNTALAGIIRLMQAEANNFPEVAQFYYDEVISRGNAMLARVLKRGVQRGEFRAIDVDQAKYVICAPMIMLVTWQHAFPDLRSGAISPKAYLDSFVDLTLHGLLRPAPP